MLWQHIISRSAWKAPTALWRRTSPTLDLDWVFTATFFYIIRFTIKTIAGHGSSLILKLYARKSGLWRLLWFNRGRCWEWKTPNMEAAGYNSPPEKPDTITSADKWAGPKKKKKKQEKHYKRSWDPVLVPAHSDPTNSPHRENAIHASASIS